MVSPRRAQERHTHSGLLGGAGEGWSGIYSAMHCNSAGSLTALGLISVISGSQTGVDITLDLAGTAIQRRTRAVRKFSATVAGFYSSTPYVNTWRGFHARWVFGTTAYASVNPLFCGLANTVNISAGAFTDFVAWPTVYAIGVYKAPSTGALDWVWRTDAATTGSASTGLVWSTGAAYELRLDCEPGGTEVVATLSDTDGGSATYTFTTFPDTNTNPAVMLYPATVVGTGGSTTHIALHAFDCIEPW